MIDGLRRRGEPGALSSAFLEEASASLHEIYFARQAAGSQRCPVWVKSGNTRREHKLSALADIRGRSPQVRFVPGADITSAPIAARKKILSPWQLGSDRMCRAPGDEVHWTEPRSEDMSSFLIPKASTHEPSMAGPNSVPFAQGFWNCESLKKTHNPLKMWNDETLSLK
jgi:hypothetical protein